MYGLYGLKHHTVEISGDVTMRDGRTNERRRRTREDRATQPLDAGRLSFAILTPPKINFLSLIINTGLGQVHYSHF